MEVEKPNPSGEVAASPQGLGAAAWTLWSSAVAIGFLFTLVDVVWSAATVGVGRLSTTFYVAFLDKMSVSVPLLLQTPFDLTGGREFLLFVLLALLTSLFLATAGAALLFPVICLLDGSLLFRSSNASRGWLRGRLWFPTLFTLIGFPGILGLVERLPRLWIVGMAWEVAAAVAVAVWGFLFVFSCSLAVGRRFARVCLAVTGVVAVVATLGSGLLAFMRPGVQAPAYNRDGRPPNILLVSVDSLRRDHVHCYGYSRETTPVIDRLASEGVRFETVVAPTSWTLPSHITLLTALPPEVHGVIQSWMQLRGGSIALAEVLWARGYTTAGVVSGPFLRAEYGFARGFDYFDDYTAVASSHDLSHRNITSPILFTLVQDWLQGWDASGRRRPFFLFLHMWDVHYDYTPPSPYDRLFDPDYAGTITGEDFERSPHIYPQMDPRDIEHLVALYDGEIRYTDHYIGEILALLADLGVEDDTIVLLTSDHGDEFFEHGNKGHRKALYDETLLVPLVIRYPERITPGTVVPRQVRLMDIAPTLLSLASIAPLPDFGGVEKHSRDLTPLLRGENAHLGALPAYGDLHAEWASLRTEQSKLIMSLSDPAIYLLYDLSTDPGEQTNMIPAHPFLAEELEAQLTAWRAERHLRPSYSREWELSDEQIRQLRALGYVD